MAKQTVKGGKMKEGKAVSAKKKSGSEREEEEVVVSEAPTTMADIKKLEQEIKDSKAHANNLVTLLSVCPPPSATGDGKLAGAAILALCRSFSHFFSEGDVVVPGMVQAERVKVKGPDGGAREKYVMWISGTYRKLVRTALSYVRDGSARLAGLSMRALIGLAAREAEAVGRSHAFTDGTFTKLVGAMVSSQTGSEPLFAAFKQRYLDEYHDLRYYTLRALASSMGGVKQGANLSSDDEEAANTEISVHAMMRNIHSLLVLIEIPEVSGNPAAVQANLFVPGDNKEGKEALPAGSKKRKYAVQTLDFTDQNVYKKAFGDTWMALMRSDLPTDVFKTILTRLHLDVIPHMFNPHLLSDLLSDSYARGGVISILALNGLFHLIQETNLEYPDFYTKLYALLDPGIFLVKYRGRFFKQLELFLKSPLIPSYLVASFLKRLARLTLSAPATGIPLCLALIYNTLKAHPPCLQLLHRDKWALRVPVAAGDDGLAEGFDPYVTAETDPAKSKAIDSSLWELQVLRKHYAPDVSRMASVFDDVITRKSTELSVTEALQMTNRSMSIAQSDRRFKNGVPLNFEAPKGMFRGEGLGSRLWGATE